MSREGEGLIADDKEVRILHDFKRIADALKQITKAVDNLYEDLNNVLDLGRKLK
ncbi:MAG: hypothetical protein SFH39_00510 [Candidatus Magnetobacterium sp. LHC-1]